VMGPPEEVAPPARENAGQDAASMTLSVSDLFLVLLASARLILAAVAVGLLVGLAVNLTQPDVYRAEATLLSEDTSTRGGMAAGPSQPFSLWQVPSRTTQALYATVLRSRAVAERVSERLGYGEWLDVPTSLAHREQAAADRIRAAVTVSETRGPGLYGGAGLITVSVETEDPVQASDIANSYVFALDEYFSENTVTSASRLRRFLERRLEESNRELEVAQVDLQRFQEKHGAININEQAAATIRLLSELEAQRVGFSVEKVAQEERYSPAHSSVRMLQAKIDALQEVIDRLTFSGEERVAYEREGRVEFFVPLKMIPELSFEASRKLLTLRSKEEIVSLFTSRLEQAKIDEAGTLPSVSVLDLAGVGRRVRPDERRNLMVALLTGLVVGCLASWALHYGRGVWGGIAERPQIAALVREVSDGWRTARRMGAALTGSLGSRFRWRAGEGTNEDVRDG